MCDIKNYWFTCLCLIVVFSDREVGKCDFADLLRAVKPVINAGYRVVALGETIEDLPTPERNEGRLHDTSRSVDNVVSCKVFQICY